MEFSEIEATALNNKELLKDLLVSKIFLSSKRSIILKTAKLLLKNHLYDDLLVLIGKLKADSDKNFLATLLFLKADVYLDLQDYDLAIKSLTEIIEMEFDVLGVDVAYNNRGYAYLRLKNYERSFQDYSKACEINPRNHSAITGLGELYWRTKRLEEACVTLKKAIKIAPEYENSWINLGTVFSLKNDPVRAYKCFMKAVTINPNSRARLGIKSIEDQYQM